ncbi:MAG: MarC family protein [Candidatus Altiarchaeales archaeon]|nr:MarC family protein [Candidatus Altiarchaeales archaeon]MBD3416719.1 MarC family protein [Candidatus Altiarchaeales archaeon]
MSGLFDLTLYILALINPISKVFIFSVLLKDNHYRDIRLIAIKSTLIAMAMLLASAAVGNLILHNVFHVDIYSLKIAGGLVLFYFGFQALTKGVFFEVGEQESLEELSIVPLASPMIAGPATITAVISFSPEYGFALTAAAMSLAVLINLSVMLCSRIIGSFLVNHNMMGALIRITGLIVATIAVQMTLAGVQTFLKTI